MATAIRITGAQYPDEHLPSSIPLRQLLNEVAGLTWIQAHPSYITSTDGKISAWADRNSGGLSFVQANVDRRAAVVTRQFGQDHLEMAQFNPAAPCFYTLSGSFSTSATFSMACMIRPASGQNLSNLHGVIGRFSNATTRNIVSVNGAAGRIEFLNGSNLLHRPFTPGQQHVVVAAFDAAAGRSKLMVNGVRTDDAEFAGSSATNTFCLGAGNNAGGAPFGGEIEGAMLATFDVFANGVVDLIQSYYRTVYGVG